MKKSRIFMAAGAFVLAIAGVMATKANNKFFSLSVKNSASFDGMTSVSGTLSQPPFTTNAAVASTTVYVGLYTTGLGIIAGTPVVTSVNLHKIYK